MDRSLRVIARRVFMGSTPVCLLAKVARKQTKFDLSLDPRFVGEIGLTMPPSLPLCADEVIQ